MAHKTKIFKKIFEANADDVIKLGEIKEFVMTQDTFIPLMGQMWDKAKEKYKKRYKQRTLDFAEWCIKNVDYIPKDKSVQELFEIWKSEK